MTTVNCQVSASADDAFEDSSGNTDITIGSEVVDNEDELFGWRFVLNVPQGSTITAATLTPYISGGTVDEPNVEFWAEAADDAAAFTAGTGNTDISGRTPVAVAAIQYSSTDLGVANGFLAVVPTGGGSFVDHVQAVVNRAGWASGNHIVFVCKGATGVVGTRDYGINMYDLSSAQACKLDVTYTADDGNAQAFSCTMDSSTVSPITNPDYVVEAY